MGLVEKTYVFHHDLLWPIAIIAAIVPFLVLHIEKEFLAAARLIGLVMEKT
jgi:hypothetical protein